MRTRSALLSLALTTLAFAGAASTASAATDAEPLRNPLCHPQEAQTLAQTREAHVYTVGPNTYGCLEARGREIYLGQHDQSHRVAFFSFNGPYLGYQSFRADAGGISSRIEVADLRRGNYRKHSLVRRFGYTMPFVPKAPVIDETEPVPEEVPMPAFRPTTQQLVTDLVVSASGHVAWIDTVRLVRACPPPLPASNGCPEASRYEVRRLDANGYRVLARSTAIRPRSLRRQGGRAIWRQGNEQRSAFLR